MHFTPSLCLRSFLFILFAQGGAVFAQDYNQLILDTIAEMPKGGVYARYRKDLPEAQRFDDLHKTVEQLGSSFSVGLTGKLEVKPEKAAEFSFCSSATYLLFAEVIEKLQKEGIVVKDKSLSRDIADVGSKTEVIQGKLDGVGIFGHWNADGPGTAVLFNRLSLGENFSSYERAKPGDFLKIFWNEHIGKGERGHLVVYMGTSPDNQSIQVWSSQMENNDGTAGYGTMWVEKSRIKRAVFSRLTRPANLVKWLKFSPEQKKSDYLIRIRETGSNSEELKEVTGLID